MFSICIDKSYDRFQFSGTDYFKNVVNEIFQNMEHPQQDRREQTHAVVQFVQEKQSGKNIVDLIPLNWLNENGNSCSYPKTKQYKHLEKWVRQCKNPEASWLQEQQIFIIKKCGRYSGWQIINELS